MLRIRRVLLLLMLLMSIAPVFHAGCGGYDEPAIPPPDMDGDGIPDDEDPDADGDGWMKEDDCNDLNPAVFPGAPDLPDISYVDSNCDGVDGDGAAAVWVSAAEGDDAASGAMTAPVRTMARAFAIAGANSAHPRDVYAVTGMYAEDVVVTSGANLYGGYGPLSAELRDRDILAHPTTIVGVNGLGKKTLQLFNNTMDVDYTVLIDGSDSAIDGVTVLGDAAGLAVIIVDADATVSHCTVSDAAPAAPREASLGVVAIAGAASAAAHEVTIADTAIDMKGTGGTADGLNYGILGLQEKGSDGALVLRAQRNRFYATGASKMAAAIAAADADADPAQGPSGDGSADIDLVADANTVDIEGQYLFVAGIFGGSFFGEGPIPAELAQSHLNRIEATSNQLTLKVAGNSAVGIAAGFVRQGSLVANNAVRIEGDVQGAAVGLLSVLAPIDVSYNTFSVVGKGFAAGAFLAGNDANPQTIPYAGSVPQAVVNNIFEVTATANGLCALYGTAESTMSPPVIDVHVASPRVFRNNDLFVHGDCPTSVVYHDVTGPNIFNDVASIADLNARAGFLAGDPAEISGNIASDPLFVNAPAGNLMVPDTSPCRDAGTSIHGKWLDLTGVTRPQGAAPDIGAYEQ